ncbi:P-loop containing nucleoside triphosphate hydrolase protein [Atractiella rhizophila]|nr:P-loop containing nucleoside triphosphate hydrolase protein [Atractiella rhizophila]
MSHILAEAMNEDASSTKGPSPFAAWKKVKKALEEKTSFCSVHEAEMFAYDLMIAGRENDELNWRLEDVQKVLLDLSKLPGNGIELLKQLLKFNIVTTEGGNRVTHQTELSFQRGFMPLVTYLTSDAVTKTLHHKSANILYTLVDQSIDDLVARLPVCLRALVEKKSVTSSVNYNRIGFKPESFVQIFVPIIQLFQEHLSRWKNARLEHPIVASELLPSMDESIEAWAKDMLSPCPTFRDTISVKSLEERTHAVSSVRRHFQNLKDSFLLRPAPVVLKKPQQNLKMKGETGVLEVVDLELMHEYYEPPGGRHDNDHSDFRNVSVIPTHQELMSQKPSYLPFNIPGAPHHLVEGSIDRHVDILFRLMREDFVGPLKKAILSLIGEMEKGENNLKKVFKKKEGGRYRLQNIEAMDLNVYLNITFLNLDMKKDVLLDMLVTLPFPSTSTLEPGALVGIIYRQEGIKVGGVSQKWKVHLGTVAKTAPKKNGSTVLSVTFFESEAYGFAISSLTKRANNTSSNFVLFEAGSILLESFRPFLEALQQLDTFRMPLSQYIGGSTAKGYIPQPISAPLKARKPGFRWKLDCLLADGNSAVYDPLNPLSRAAARATLGQKTGLDPSQIDALLDCLSRELAIVEGPPGTGKSYLGCELTRVLLNNGYSGILTLCFTNHALDQFLEHLLDGNVTKKLIRIGARSKSDKLTAYNLREAVEALAQLGRRRATWQEYKFLKSEREQGEKRLKEVCDQISRAVKKELNWSYYLTDFLYGNSKYEESLDSLLNPPQFLVELVGNWEIAGMEGHPLHSHQAEWWLHGADLKFLSQAAANLLSTQHSSILSASQSYFARLNDIDDSGIDEHQSLQWDQQEHLRQQLASWCEPKTNRTLTILLQTNDVWSFSILERRKVFEFWQSEAAVELSKELERLRRQQKHVETEIRELRDMESLQILRKAEVIGCTTTGAAKISTLLKSVAPRVLIVEEAGEVLESQIIANLVPSIEFLILIGDHKQLRPHISSHHLSLDSKGGQLFRLDESLFERLVSVKGLAKDMVFFNHSHREDQEDMVSSSKTNQWEVEMIGELVLHLIRQGYNRPGDIAVLTGYLGQLFKLKKHLGKLALTVVLDDRDKADLIAALGEEMAVELEQPAETIVKRTTAAAEVICRTIDNFQGEEAKIIILSLVRNSGMSTDSEDDNTPISGTIGFLKSPNRTNVALSRAKHGLYVLGNASLLRQRSPIWREVLQVMASTNSILPGLPIRCENHPDDIVELVNEVGVLPLLAPDGGCQRLCSARLKCGHTCKLRCHPDDPNHVAFRCPEPCPRLLAPCSHPCPKFCYETCGNCGFPVLNIQLPCGHTQKDGTCYQQQHPETVRCQALVRKVLRCGHASLIPCSQNIEEVICNQPCGGALDCRHEMCQARCCDCPRLNTGSHSPHKCERPLQCKHVCQSTACCLAAQTNCPPCLSACSKKCQHFNCSEGRDAHKCGDPCKPCLEPCIWECRHRGSCLVPCGQPCSRLPCDEPCPNSLPCRCPCPSFCGERCDLQKCPLHATDQEKDQVVDLIEMRTLRDIIEEVLSGEQRLLALDCGHVFSAETLDGLYEIQKFYKVDSRGQFVGLDHPSFSEMVPLSCPHCRTIITHKNVYRYGRIIKRIELEVQERNQMQRMSTRIELKKRELAIMDYEENKKSLEAALGKSDAQVLAEVVNERDFEPQLTQRLSAIVNDDSTFVPPLANFKDLRVYGFSPPVSKLWATTLQPIFGLYKQIFDLTEQKSQHTIAYESAFAHLYRNEKVLFEDGAVRVRDAHRSAMEAATTKIGCPKPQADTISTIKLIWLSLQSRYQILAASQALATHVSRVASLPGQSAAEVVAAIKSKEKQLCLLDKLKNFILETCLRDAKRALRLAYESTSLKLAIQGHFHVFSSSFRLNRLSVERKLDQMSTEGQRPSDIADEAERKMNCEYHLHLSALHDKIFSSFTDQIKEAREQLQKVLSLWKKMIDTTRKGVFYDQVSDEETISILKALKHDIGSTNGHFFRCPEGHPFTIGECGGAMQVSNCPQCGSVIGGSNHQLAEGNSRDRRMEELSLQAGYGVQMQHWGEP